MVFPAAIREKSQRWVALSCDAHLMFASSGRIRQPCTFSLSDPVSCGTFLISQHFCAGNSVRPLFVHPKNVSSVQKRHFKRFGWSLGVWNMGKDLLIWKETLEKPYERKRPYEREFVSWNDVWCCSNERLIHQERPISVKGVSERELYKNPFHPLVYLKSRVDTQRDL